MSIWWVIGIAWLIASAIGFVWAMRKINTDPYFRRKYVDRED